MKELLALFLFDMRMSHYNSPHQFKIRKVFIHLTT